MYLKVPHLFRVLVTKPKIFHLLPQLKRVIKELNGAVLGVEIDIDKDQDIAKQAGINGTPTVQLFKEKLLKKQWQGVKQRSESKEAIKNII